MVESTSPQISIILPSFNGADTLPHTLQAFADLKLPESGAQFILIDNASTDDTFPLMQRHALSLGAIVLQEPRVGKSFALNQGLRVASGELILFTDDDIIPDPNWLIEYVEGARKHPSAGMFSGQNRPTSEIPLPEWLVFLSDAGRCCASSPIARKEQEIDPLLVKGSNMLVRRSALGRHLFDEGKHNFSGSNSTTGTIGGAEDTHFALQVCQDGRPAVYLPAAIAKHIIQPHEMTLSYVLARSFRIGRSSILLLSESARPSRIRRLVSGISRLVVGSFILAVGRKKRASEMLLNGAYLVGSVKFDSKKY